MKILQGVLDFFFDGEAGEKAVGFLSDFHGHQPAFIVEKDHATHLVAEPCVGVLFGLFREPVTLFPVGNAEGMDGDHIDIHVRGARGDEAGAEAGGGFG